MLTSLIGDSKFKNFSYGVLGLATLSLILCIVNYQLTKRNDVPEDKKKTTQRLTFVNGIASLLLVAGALIMAFYPLLVGATCIDTLSPLKF
jgi:hypothetical protein